MWCATPNPGGAEARVFSIDLLDRLAQKRPRLPDGLRWPEVVARVPAADLTPPHAEHGIPSQGD